MAEKCNKCKKDMKLLREQVVSGTKYNIYICEKCNTQIAKSE